MFDTRILGADYGLDCGCTVKLKSNNRVYEIFLSADASSGSAEHEYLQRILDENEAHSDAAFADLYDCLIRLAQPYFQSYMAQDSLAARPTLTLHDVLHPSTTRLQLQTEDSQLKLLPRLDLTNALGTPFSSCLHKKDLPTIRTYESSKIAVLETLQNDRTFKVMADGNVLCAKVLRGYSDSRALKREILCLHRLSSANFVNPPRIPTIHATIVAKDNCNSVVGFLMDYIQSGWEGNADLSMYSHESDRWATEIEAAVRQFHEVGVIWGDAKVDNIILKRDHCGERLDPYIIDFGDSWTDDWVDEDLAETAEGDLQGLQRIREFLSQRKL